MYDGGPWVSGLPGRGSLGKKRLTTLFYNDVSECAFTLCVIAVSWLTEALTLSATALLPPLLFLLFGVMKPSQEAGVYFKYFHLLLIRVICLATSIEKWGLHQRIALRMVTLVGDQSWMVVSLCLPLTLFSGPQFADVLMLGFMSSCAFLSMWVQNTSAVAMVMPIVEVVIQQILKAAREASGHCFVLVESGPGKRRQMPVIEEDYSTLGPMSPQEVVTGVMFILMAALWVYRDPGFIQDWASLFLPQYAGYVTDATMALLAGAHVLHHASTHKPSADKHGIKYACLSVPTTSVWSVLLGGKPAISSGEPPSHSNVTIASITEVASNAATIAIFLPILTPLVRS
ncbi:unnamed protein product [Coregonus sp. 'balchen']|nr:unnamed protein product [Coregonus sp. 'balchen']